MGPALPLIITFWGLLFCTLFRNAMWNLLIILIPSIRVGELVVDEGLSNYFKTLDDLDRNWSAAEEENMR